MTRSSGSSSRGPSPTKAKPPRSPRPLPRAAAPAPPAQPPLLLTVRFSTSLPDLHLDIPYPSHTTVVALKHLIRTRLSEPNTHRRLRFIHGGRILPDAAVLSSVLRVLPPPPPSANAAAAAAADPKGKGKAPEGAPPPQRVYVNCSIGDALGDAELEAEAQAAAKPASTSGGGRGGDERGGQDGGLAARTRTERPPRGFDRLLAAGFGAAEVNALRLQFSSIQAARHTPDSMPSPDSLRRLEDVWLESNGGGGGGGMGGVGGGGDADPEEFGINGLLDVLVRGMIIGFVWPMGSIGWLVREEGLWSRKWQVFVSFGFVLSLLIGMIKSLSGER